MRVFDSIPSEKGLFLKPVVTIGNFDGVHLGHLEIFERMNSIAREEGGESVVITFREHPKKVLYPELEMKSLLSLDEKIRSVESAGIDNLIIMDFTREMASMLAGHFINDILFEKVGASHIVMGYDHAFGKDREGNIDYLISLSEKRDFSVTQVPPLLVDGHPVSSTWIKNSILEGDVTLAAKLLGRRYSVEGCVVKGFGRGRKLLGFPTANIDYTSVSKVLPPDGVYASFVFIENRRYNSVLNIGRNPTFNNEKKTIEVNIFDFDRDIYNSDIRIEFVDSIRGEQKFTGIEELIAQMGRDKLVASSILESIK